MTEMKLTSTIPQHAL